MLPRKWRKVNFCLAMVTQGGLSLCVASAKDTTMVSEGSSSKDTCHTKTATKQNAKARHAPGVIQKQPKHPSFLSARHEGGECLKGYLTLCRTRPTWRSIAESCFTVGFFLLTRVFCSCCFSCCFEGLAWVVLLKYSNKYTTEMLLLSDE